MRSATLRTSDGLDLEAEWSDADTPVATIVLCHPHPQYGGTMRSLVISALFEGLPPLGYSCLRFNFRGVEHSEGAWDEGRSEIFDVRAALDAAKESPSGPLVVVGWSFGGDMALAVDDPALAGWIGIAPPLRFGTIRDDAAVGADPRPKLFILGSNDEFRAPADVAHDIRAWENTSVEVIAGASHFFVGRTDRVVDLAADFVGSLAPG